MKKKKKIAYSFLIGDLFHYGHLKMLETARNNSDYHICGVISDEVAKKWISPLICKFEERSAVIKTNIFVNEVMVQNSMDPTENLKKILTMYPDSKILLVQSHLLGENILGSDYIYEINGEIINHDFYTNLSRDFIAKSFFNTFIERTNLKNISFNEIQFGDREFYKAHFSTKANTLKKLKDLLKSAIIEKEFIFTVDQWNKEKNSIIKQISVMYDNKKIVIRSSSLNEDSIENSKAGFYHSILNVDTANENEVCAAIEEVINSYKRENGYSKEDQVLIQKQTEDVHISGVVLTRNLWNNTPYYFINYDSLTDKTNTVTGGVANNKIEVLRDIDVKNLSPQWKNLINSIREIESNFKGIALDIEFAIKKNDEVVIFQVRPLAANSKFNSYEDDKIKESINSCMKKYKELFNSEEIFTDELYLSDMAFWNPAELIGDRPGYLDLSLFNHLIMKKSWNSSLVELGYTKINADLLVLIGNKPYINTQNGFLSLLPEKLSSDLKKKLLKFYNKKLKNNPELHDKIEFEIVHNCYSFNFKKEEKELLDNGFSKTEIEQLKNSLLELTNNILNNFKKIISVDRKLINELEKRYHEINMKISLSKEWKSKLDFVYELIDDCKRLGIEQFCKAARFAFIGNSFLKSLKEIDEISSEELDWFMNSISTVATEIEDDFGKLRKNKITVRDFLFKYGHLRPGTYDVTKLPYSKNISYLNITNELSESEVRDYSFKEDKRESIEEKLTAICNRHEINSNGRDLLNFIKLSIESRELFKFIYTKNISLALELIAEIGKDFGFEREELSYLDYYSIINNKDSCSREEIIDIWKNLIISRREEKRINLLLSLSSIIFSDNDFIVVSSHISTPNFITDLVVEGDIISLDKEKDNFEISNKIVVIEKADPGYDWIFTKNIKAVITKYGGAASHMAIRCAEFNIPAAIGCGELLFTKVLKANKVILSCRNKTISTI